MLYHFPKDISSTWKLVWAELAQSIQEGGGGGGGGRGQDGKIEFQEKFPQLLEV